MQEAVNLRTGNLQRDIGIKMDFGDRVMIGGPISVRYLIFNEILPIWD